MTAAERTGELPGQLALPGTVYGTALTERPSLTRVPVAELRPGMVLHPTGRTIRSRPTAGARTPAGKRELLVSAGRDNGGRDKCVQWNARTIVSVYD